MKRRWAHSPRMVGGEFTEQNEKSNCIIGASNKIWHNYYANLRQRLLLNRWEISLQQGMILLLRLKMKIWLYREGNEKTVKYIDGERGSRFPISFRLTSARFY